MLSKIFYRKYYERTNIKNKQIIIPRYYNNILNFSSKNNINLEYKYFDLLQQKDILQNIEYSKNKTLYTFFNDIKYNSVENELFVHFAIYNQYLITKKDNNKLYKSFINSLNDFLTIENQMIKNNISLLQKQIDNMDEFLNSSNNNILKKDIHSLLDLRDNVHNIFLDNKMNQHVLDILLSKVKFDDNLNKEILDKSFMYTKFIYNMNNTNVLKATDNDIIHFYTDYITIDVSRLNLNTLISNCFTQYVKKITNNYIEI